MKRIYSIIIALLVTLSVTPAPSVDAAAPAKANALTKSAAPAKKSAAVAQKPVVTGNMLEEIRKRGTMVVGISPQVPWVMRDPVGEWQGYEIDVARARFRPRRRARACPRSFRATYRCARGRQSRHRQRRLFDHAAAGTRRRFQQPLCDIGNASRRARRSCRTRLGSCRRDARRPHRRYAC